MDICCVVKEIQKMVGLAKCDSDNTCNVINEITYPAIN